MLLRKKDVLYGEILERLVTARYRFGQRILVKELCAETGASRQPIMTALNALSTDGFVRIIPQVGCEVISPSLQDIVDFYRLFERLEGLMTELAATRQTDVQMKALRKINLRLKELERDDPQAAEEYRVLNQTFHATLHQMAHAPLLDTRQASIFAMSDFFLSQTASFPAHLGNAADEHDVIIAALEARDPERARVAAEAHIASVGRTVAQRFAASLKRPTERRGAHA